MKSLFSILLTALFLFPLFSSAKVVARSGKISSTRGVEETNNPRQNSVNPAIPAEKPLAYPSQLMATLNCKGQCNTDANRAFSALPAEVRISINSVGESVAKDRLLQNATTVTDNINSATQNKGDKDASVEALVNAIKLSERERWPTEAKDKLNNFIKGLATDGINKEETNKLEEVRERCRV